MDYKHLTEINDLRFALVPALQHRKKHISANARILYGLMLTHSIDYTFTLRIKELADIMELSGRQIKRLVKELVNNGVVDSSKTNTGNTYKLNPFYGE